LHRNILSWLGGEFGEIVKPECLLNAGNLLHNALKTMIVEQLVFLVLELVAQFIILLGRHQAPNCRKQHGILSSFMRTIHSNELLERRAESMTGFGIFETGGCCQLYDPLGQTTTCFVLQTEGLHKSDEFASILEAGK
jgi:hypothetical protein